MKEKLCKKTVSPSKEEEKRKSISQRSKRIIQIRGSFLRLAKSCILRVLFPLRDFCDVEELGTKREKNKTDPRDKIDSPSPHHCL